MPTASTLPLPLAAQTVESLCTEHDHPPRTVYWFVLVGAAAALAALPFIEVDVSVDAPGIVRPARDRVGVGRPLLEVTTSDLDERLVHDAVSQHEKDAMSALLDSLSTARVGRPDESPDVTPGRAVELFAILGTPLAGPGQGLVGLSGGAVVEPSQVTSTPSPGDRLVVEAFVSAREIGLVRCGQAVRLQVDAFPSQQWGVLDARVIAITEDASNAASGAEPIFEVMIKPMRTQLRLANGFIGHLGQGMTASARFVAARRPLLQSLGPKVRRMMAPKERKWRKEKKLRTAAEAGFMHLRGESLHHRFSKLSSLRFPRPSRIDRVF